MPENYCTLIELHTALSDSALSDNAEYDPALNMCISHASRVIDSWTGRPAGAYCVSSTDTTTRYFNGSGMVYQWIDEITAAPTELAVSWGGGVSTTDYTAVSSSDYFTWPDNETPYKRLDLDTINGAYSVFPRYRRSIKVTAAFGYSTTPPAPIKQAVIIQAARWFKRGQQAYQDTGAIVDLGQLRYTKLDPDVAEIIAHYRRITV